MHHRIQYNKRSLFLQAGMHKCIPYERKAGSAVVGNGFIRSVCVQENGFLKLPARFVCISPLLSAEEK